ncbi:unnamed protein product [Mytilus edulis]|uniref:Thrombospondin-like N-terminal domain-containing protein n=1 Tax=Mytilus edulis TaxID=6550 RepID=A0A8S3V8N6_MYTED|nr:unnamed protein product [Mytilus edulis]
MKDCLGLSVKETEVDLLAAIGLPDPSKGVTYDVGLEGFPAFKLDKSSYIRKAAETYFTDRIGKINDFAIGITVKVFSKDGILFAVKNIYETVIAFGVRITAAGNGKHNIVLYYKEDHQYGQISVTIGNFTVDNIDRNSFTKLAIKVQGDTVTLFDNCEEVERQQVLNRQPLQFSTGSPLYIGQGGPNFEDTSFEGVIQELKYYTNPAKAEELDCLSLDSGSGSGDKDDDEDRFKPVITLVRLGEYG